VLLVCCWCVVGVLLVWTFGFCHDASSHVQPLFFFLLSLNDCPVTYYYSRAFLEFTFPAFLLVLDDSTIVVVEVWWWWWRCSCDSGFWEDWVGDM